VFGHQKVDENANAEVQGVEDITTNEEAREEMEGQTKVKSQNVTLDLEALAGIGEAALDVLHQQPPKQKGVKSPATLLLEKLHAKIEEAIKENKTAKQIYEALVGVYGDVPGVHLTLSRVRAFVREIREGLSIEDEQPVHQTKRRPKASPEVAA
jgi:hypothetical protein